MNKTDREYFEKRVQNIVKCTNGNIATILNKKKKETGLTNKKKFEMINSGKAVLKQEHELSEVVSFYNKSKYEILLKCFDYPTTDSQKEKIAFNKSIDSKIESIMQEVELEGKRIIDKVVFGIIAIKDIPDALHALSEMANLARN